MIAPPRGQADCVRTALWPITNAGPPDCLGTPEQPFHRRPRRRKPRAPGMQDLEPFQRNPVKVKIVGPRTLARGSPDPPANE